MAKEWAIGVDLGGTKIEAAKVDTDGNIKNRSRVKTKADEGFDAVCGRIEEMVEKLIDEQDGPKPTAVGIGVAGQIEPESGTVRYAPNLGWKDENLGSALHDKLDIPVVVLNDVRAATWGEWLHGSGRGCDDLVCMFVGTGIGGGIVSGGQMLRGNSNTAGEIGHMTVLLDGPECHCGNYGCMEALAGSWAIERDARKAVKKDPERASLILEMADGDPEAVKAKMVVDAWHEKDPLAEELMKNVADALGAGLTGIANAFNPERIIMGGGVTEHMPDLIQMVERRVQGKALKASIQNLSFVEAELHDDSGVIGAAAYAFRTEKEDDK